MVESASARTVVRQVLTDTRVLLTNDDDVSRRLLLALRTSLIDAGQRLSTAVMVFERYLRPRPHHADWLHGPDLPSAASQAVSPLAASAVGMRPTVR
jgi:hypothetical protein